MSLQEFYDQLEKHDWFHMMSDDGDVDERGQMNRRRLVLEASTSAEKAELFLAYQAYVYAPVEGKKLPKPARPEAA